MKAQSTSIAPWAARWFFRACLLAGLLQWAATTQGAETVEYSYDSMERLVRATYSSGLVIDYVYDSLGNRLARTVSAAPVVNSPPPAAVLDLPEGATGVPTNPTLTWTAVSDPDPGDSVTYFVFFGTSPNPPLVFSGRQNSWAPAELECFTKYYWYVVARDNHNAESRASVRTFTTGSRPPKPAFAALPPSGPAPFQVTFQDQSAYDCGEPVAWQWDFNNDGVVESTVRNPTYTYSQGGNYTVKLTVTDINGTSATAVKPNFVSVLGPNMVDLAVMNMRIESAAGYRNLLVSYSVTNRGTVPFLAPFPWSDGFYFSQHPTLDSRAMMTAVFQENQVLLPGAVYSRTNLIPGPISVTGDNYLLVKVDANDAIVEKDEADNILSIGISGRLPDLVAGSGRFSGQASAGSSIEVTYAVTNRGNLDIRGLGVIEPEWNDSVYLSTNSTWDATATFVGFLPVEKTLAAGAGCYMTNTVTLPSRAAGSYFLLIKVNDFDSVLESDKSNNMVSIPISITTADLAPFFLSAASGVASDQLLEVVTGVTNLSSTAADWFWIDSLYLSTNAAFGPEAYQLAEVYQFEVLPGNQAYFTTNSVRLPGWAAGTYYLIAVTDSKNWVAETSKNNNVLAKPIALTAPSGHPDLAPVSVKTPSLATAGQPVEVVYTVTNSGRMPVDGEWFDLVALTTNGAPAGKSITVGFVYLTNLLAAGSSYSVTNAFEVPRGISGPWYLSVETDTLGQVFEANETNNTALVPLTIQLPNALPDLIVDSVNVPAVAAPGASIQVTYSVRNKGDLVAAGVWVDGISLLSFLPDSDPVSLATSFVATPVQPGANYSRTATVNLPSSLEAGSYSVQVEANSTTMLYESDNSNNVLSASLLIQGTSVGPDLAPLVLTAPANASPGETIQYAYSVTNLGSGNAAGFWSDFIGLSPSTMWDEGDVLDSQSIFETVAKGGSYTRIGKVTVPDLEEGLYYLMVQINGDAQLDEGDTANNVISVPLILQISGLKPDLAPVQFSAPSTGNPGSYIDIDYAITNQGASSAAGGWYDQLVLSTNAVWDPSDYQLSKRSQPNPLVAGAGYAYGRSVTLPNWSPGTYYLILRTDMTDVVAESDEQNNFAISPIALGPPPFRFARAEMRPDGSLLLNVEATPGRRYSLLASTNLIDWNLAFGWDCTNSTTTLSLPANPAVKSRFYRLSFP